MATYPTLPVDPSSRRITRDGRDEQLAVGGGTYIRNFYSADKYDFEIRHSMLSATDLATLAAFYATNATLTVDLLWPEDGVTYTGLRFGKGGLRTQWVSPGRRDAFVRLVAA